jgi:HAD superfamily hydrolase (TIGR01509 family)
MAVVTGGARRVVTRSLEYTGLAPLFPHVVTFEDVPRGKPAPDMFLHAAALLGVDPTRCVVFEDGEPGIIGALAAGMRVVRVTVEENG